MRRCTLSCVGCPSSTLEQRPAGTSAASPWSFGRQPSTARRFSPGCKPLRGGVGCVSQNRHDGNSDREAGFMLKRDRAADDGERVQRLVPTPAGPGRPAGASSTSRSTTAVAAPASPAAMMTASRTVPGPGGAADELDPALVWEEIENDPDRLAELLDPTPSALSDRYDELAGEIEQIDSAVEQVRSDLDSLCSDLSYTDALSNELLSCP